MENRGGIDMSKLGGILTAIGVTFLGFLWFYGVMYSWLWLGLLHSTTTGWIAGYAVLFAIFLIISFVVLILLVLGYILALMIAED